MYREQESSHLEWPDHTLHPTYSAGSLQSWPTPFLWYRWGQAYRGTLLPNTTHTTQVTAAKRRANFGARGFQVNFHPEVQVRIQCHLTATMHAQSLSHVQLCNPWTQQSNSLHSEVTTLAQSMNRLPPLRRRRGCKMVSRPNTGELWPLSQIQAVRTFWDNTTLLWFLCWSVVWSHLSRPSSQSWCRILERQCNRPRVKMMVP